MEHVDVRNPWVFTGVIILVWVLLWAGIEVLLFDDDLLGAVITGVLSGLAFAISYIILRRQID